MRLLPFSLVLTSLALTSLALTGCDGGGSVAQPEADQRPVIPVAEVPLPAHLPARQASPPPEPVRAVPKAAEKAIVESDGLAPRRIDEDRLVPLVRIIEIALHRVPGEVIEVELDDDDDDDDEPEYELEILTADGRSIEMKISARRGTILEVEED